MITSRLEKPKEQNQAICLVDFPPLSWKKCNIVKNVRICKNVEYLQFLINSQSAFWNEFKIICSWLSEIARQKLGLNRIDSFDFIGTPADSFKLFIIFFIRISLIAPSFDLVIFISHLYSKSNILLNLTLNCDYIQDCLLNQTVVCNRISCINFPFFSILIFVFIDVFFVNSRIERFLSLILVWW